jgi:hypothetical protein
MAISNNSTGLRPGVCTSTTRPTAPYEGQHIYETDTDKVLVWNGSAWLYSATPQTTEMGAWQSYTPTWTNLTIGNGTVTAQYSTFNKIGFLDVKLEFGSTTSITAANARFTVPSGWTVAENPISSLCDYLNKDIENFTGFLLRWSSTELFPNNSIVNGTYLQRGGLSSTTPFTWGTGDVMQMTAVVRLS